MYQNLTNFQGEEASWLKDLLNASASTCQLKIHYYNLYYSREAFNSQAVPAHIRLKTNYFHDLGMLICVTTALREIFGQKHD